MREAAVVVVVVVVVVILAGDDLRLRRKNLMHESLVGKVITESELTKAFLTPGQPIYRSLFMNMSSSTIDLNALRREEWGKKCLGP